MSKDMIELFNPLTFNLVLDTDRPYFEVDGARTYLVTEEGYISQNAVEIALQLKVQKDEYEQNFKALRTYLADTLAEGTPAQKGNRKIEKATRKTTSNQHKAVLKALAEKVFKGDEEKVQKVLDSAVVPNEKKAVKVDGKLL